MANGEQPSGSRLIYVIALIFALLSLGLQVAGLVTYGWLVMDFGYLNIDMKISMGLWQIRFCVLTLCQTKDISAFWGDFTGGASPVTTEMWEYRIETILGCLFILVATVCLLKLACCSSDGIYNNCKGYWIVSCVCSSLSAVMSLTASGKYGRSVADAHNLLDGIGLSPLKFPYSIVITGVGGLVAGLVFIIIVIETCRAMNAMNRRNQGQTFSMSPYPTGQPYGAQPYGAQPYGVQPYGAQQQPYSSQPPSYGHGYGSPQPEPGYNPSSYDPSRYSSSKKYPPTDYGESMSSSHGRRY